MRDPTQPAAPAVDVAGTDAIAGRAGLSAAPGGRLTLLEGPERLETGWWDEDGITRDYYTAINPQGMRLWVFRNRSRTAAGICTAFLDDRLVTPNSMR